MDTTTNAQRLADADPIKQLNGGAFVKLGSVVRSIEIGKLAAALAKAQGSFKPATHGRDVKIETKERIDQKTGKMIPGRVIKFEYAEFKEIVGVTRKALSDNGISVMQPFAVGQGKIKITTLAMHESGEFMQFETEFPALDTDPKAISGVITYCKRYSYQAAFVVVADFDADLDSEDEEKGPKTKKDEQARNTSTERPTDGQGRPYKHIKPSNPVPVASQKNKAQAVATDAKPVTVPRVDANGWPVPEDPKPAAGDPKPGKTAAPAHVIQAFQYLNRTFAANAETAIGQGELAKFMAGRRLLDLKPEELELFKEVVDRDYEDMATSEVPF